MLQTYVLRVDDGRALDGLTVEAPEVQLREFLHAANATYPYIAGRPGACVRQWYAYMSVGAEGEGAGGGDGGGGLDGGGEVGGGEGGGGGQVESGGSSAGGGGGLGEEEREGGKGNRAVSFVTAAARKGAAAAETSRNSSASFGGSVARRRADELAGHGCPVASSEMREHSAGLADGLCEIMSGQRLEA
eukprot:CAMPEP_0185287206 /NCGR_PEP_ID=MMETSP1363-20130426/2690_1 /TAXON_ID=38817 /ORGANISM="Gephyrocapsa oceanica, Strain RCC1303" /LENGTH=188 /DNA_ID=CAMNT_0027883039 /DNA_START=345 /DNA_END=912 /DNA_ORIENTATION=-